MVATRIPSRLVVVIVAAVSWFAVGCSKSNTVTGPMATATVLQGHLTASRPSGLVPVNLATVSVQQGSRILETTSGTSGFYAVVGPEVGVASVTATGTAPGGYYEVKGTATITLHLGFNDLDILLNAAP